jgi:hypothetical protein
MRAGTRALGVAESFDGDRVAAESSRPGESPASPPRSTLAGAVVRADRAVDGFVFGSCTVGGTDLTPALVDCWERLGREDVRHVLVAGVALAWFNVLDLHALHDRVDRPVLAVTFEASTGLEPALRDAFEGDELETRLAAYESLPPRQRVSVGGDRALFVRSVGGDADEAAAIVRAHTHEAGHPEPLRVARFAARAADEWEATESERRPTGAASSDP